MQLHSEACLDLELHYWSGKGLNDDQNKNNMRPIKEMSRSLFDF